MTESIVQTQTQIGFLNQSQDAECKQLISDGIYTICAETGEVIGYDYETFFVTNSEGIDKKSRSDRVFSHYRPHNVLLPNAGIGTIPAGFGRNLTTYAFAHRLSKLIIDSTQKAVFMRVAQKIAHKKIKHKLYIIGAFAIRYCSVDFNQVLQLLLNFSKQDEETVRQRLSRTVENLSFILNSKKVGLADIELQTRKKFLQQFTLELLSKYGYSKYADKFLKLYHPSLVKIAIILLLLKDNRKEEAKQLYESPPKLKTVFKHFIVNYEINGQKYVKRLKHSRLRSLVYGDSRVYSFKIVL
jgi:hypothetical protein